MYISYLLILFNKILIYLFIIIIIIIYNIIYMYAIITSPSIKTIWPPLGILNNTFLYTEVNNGN